MANMQGKGGQKYSLSDFDILQKFPWKKTKRTLLRSL